MNLDYNSRIIKYILFLFNLIFVITGLILLLVGISVKAYYHDYDTFLDDKYYSLPNLLIAIGVIIFLISFFGCYGALRESWLLIYCFSILLIIIFILELSAGIAGYVLRNRTASYLENELLQSIKKYKTNSTDQVTMMWDLIQNKFECCGVNSFDDWKNQFKDLLPQSCCITKPGIVGNSSCTSLNENTAIHFKKGCEKAFGDFVRDHAVTIGSVGLIIAFIQLAGIGFACHLSKKVKNQFYST